MSVMQTGTWAELASVRYAASTGMFSIGIALHAFNAFIASTTMPSAAVELDAVSLLSWATAGYLVASIVGGAAAAALKVRFGAQAALLGASVAFVAGSILFGTAGAALPLVAGRVLQGAGEGVVMACCYMLIPEIFPKSLVPRVFALESVVWAAAAFGGPLVAGAISEYASWRAAAMVSVPVSLVFMALVPLCTPRASGTERVAVALPLLQLGLVAAGVFLLSTCAGIANAWSAAVALVAGCAALIAAVAIDDRMSARLLPRGAFAMSHPVGAGLLLVLLMTLVEAPAAIYVAFLGAKVWGLGPLTAGFLSAIGAITWSFTAIAVSHMPRLSAAAHVRPAPLILAAGLGLQAMALIFESLAAAVAAQALVGMAFGFSWARLCEHVMSVAPDDERDFAMGALPTVQSAGLSVGTALFGAAAAWLGLQAHQTADEVVAVIAPLFAVAAVIAVASTIAARRAA